MLIILKFEVMFVHLISIIRRETYIDPALYRLIWFSTDLKRGGGAITYYGALFLCWYTRTQAVARIHLQTSSFSSSYMIWTIRFQIEFQLDSTGKSLWVLWIKFISQIDVSFKTPIQLGLQCNGPNSAVRGNILAKLSHEWVAWAVRLEIRTLKHWFYRLFWNVNTAIYNRL